MNFALLPLPGFLAGMLACLALLGAPHAFAAEFRVGALGPAGGCTHNNLADAIAAAAAAATPDDHVIRLSNNVSYFNQQHVLAAFPDTAPLFIVGGYDNCADDEYDAAAPTLIGGVAGGGPIFRVTSGSVVVLAALDLAGAGDYAVRADSSAVVQIVSSALRNSEGGLEIDGASAEVYGTEVRDNDATPIGGNGGGVRCVNSALYLQDVLISENQAIDGGGAYLVDCPTTLAGDVSVMMNSATRGGGLFVEGSTVGDVGAGGIGSKGAGPSTGNTLIFGNVVVGFGGGLHLDLAASYDVANTRIVGNTADLGGAGVFLAGGSTLRLESDFSTCAQVPCTEISDNDLISGIFGSALRATGSTVTVLSGAVNRNVNPPDNAYPVFLDDSVATFEGVEAFGNTGPVVFRATNGSDLTLAFLSFARNFNEFAGPAVAVDAIASTARIYSSALQDIGGFTTGSGGSLGAADCLIANTLSGVAATRSLIGDPQFRDPISGDLSLAPGSPAIDYCDDTAYAPISTDIDGDTRGRDDAQNPNGAPGVAGGTFDLGADELSPIFADGFES